MSTFYIRVKRGSKVRFFIETSEYYITDREIGFCIGEEKVAFPIGSGDEIQIVEDGESYTVNITDGGIA